MLYRSKNENDQRFDEIDKMEKKIGKFSEFKKNHNKWKLRKNTYMFR